MFLPWFSFDIYFFVQSGNVFPDTGYGQNTVRDSGNVDGIRAWTTVWEVGIAKFEHGRVVGKENEMRDSYNTWDAGFSRKKSGNARFPDPVCNKTLLQSSQVQA